MIASHPIYPSILRRGGLCCLLALLCGFALVRNASAIGEQRYVEESASAGSFPIVQKEGPAEIYVDTNDFAGVVRTARDLQKDITRVTGVTPKLVNGEKNLGPNVIIVGTIGKSALIDRLISEHKIDASKITGKWEAYFTQVVPNPIPGVTSALVIVGSDKRATIYGIYDLSEQMGVSPWYWWADVPVSHKATLFVKSGIYLQGSPSVRYRGIFLNDEAPDLTNWVREKYGRAPGIGGDVANYGHQFYTNLFELILRLRGNYLWPAMWNNAFNEDDPENPRLADEYGIVMGTSHQEPMLRAQKEWDRSAEYGKKYRNWNYAIEQQQPVLQNFWREGVKRNKAYESIFTVGLRTENDSGAPVGKELTEQIVNVQRKILAEEVNADLTKVPQLWCLYKEVQDYYNDGLRPPDDVTLLWAEDNWGNVRRLPTADERHRAGGAGIYYHFDYHGGPRSYQWLNTSPIAKIWDQLSLAKQYGADRIWIVNVGHFKGYEFPMEYFLDLGWNTEKWTNDNLNEYTRLWAAREFGPEHASDIADILAKYSKYNGRRKPELVDASTYSVVNYNEFETVVADFKAIADKAEKISSQLSASQQDAFYQLILFPAKACALVNEMYLSAAKNALYAKQSRASANDFSKQTHALFEADTNLMHYFNVEFAGGKWNHFMDQSHVGYTTWRDPPQNTISAIKLTEVEVPDTAALGVAVEGSDAAWPANTNNAVLPRFDSLTQQRHYLDLFNKGKAPFQFTAVSSAPWIQLEKSEGTIEKDERLWVNVDWNKAASGTASGTITISGAGTNVVIKVEAIHPSDITRESLTGFAESAGFVSIEPEHFTKKTTAGDNRWIRIEDYGRTLSGMRATCPVDAPAATPGKDSPCLEYQMYLYQAAPVEITTVTSPVLNFAPDRGVRFAVSFDDEPPQIVTLVPQKYSAQNGNRDWEKSVEDNARAVKTKHEITKPGYHTLKYWMVDPGVVLQKLIVDTGGLKPSYLGPPESFHRLDSISASK